MNLKPLLKMKLTDIKPNPDNPRVIRDEKFKRLCKSIQDFPKMMELRPIVIDSDNVVLGGNMRLKALQSLGFKDVPDSWVRRAEDLTEEEKKRFIITDNAGFGEWDWDMLANEWNADDLVQWGLDVPVFDVENLEAQEDDYEIPDTIETDIVLGDLFEIGEHRLLCGDSTQTDTFEKLFNGQMADMVLTDPPYNVDYTGKTKDALKIENDKKGDGDFYQFLYDFYTAQSTVCKTGCAWYIWHADSEGANFRLAMKNAGIMLKQCLIWVKSSMVMGRQDYQWKHEPCLYGWKEGAAHRWYSDRKQTTVLNFDRPNRNAEHPTMKPIPLFAYQIGNSSKQGDIISDAFGGSGTTMVACHQIKRKAYIVEYDPKYCQVIIDRMRKLDPTLIIKKNGIEIPN
jgi:DNA modification methylase